MQIPNLISSTALIIGRAAPFPLCSQLVHTVIRLARAIWHFIRQISAFFFKPRINPQPPLHGKDPVDPISLLSPLTSHPSRELPPLQLSQVDPVDICAVESAGLKTPTECPQSMFFVPTTPERSPPLRKLPNARCREIKRTVHKFLQEDPLPLRKVPKLRTDAEITQLVVNGWTDVLTWEKEQFEPRISYG